MTKQKDTYTISTRSYLEKVLSRELKPLLDYASFQAESLIEEKIEELNIDTISSFEVEFRPVIKINIPDINIEILGTESDNNE